MPGYTGEMRRIGFFSVPYTRLETGECAIENFRKMCSGSAVFQMQFAEDKQGAVYADANPASNDGYEYKMVGSKQLFVWSQAKWMPAMYYNMTSIKDAKGSKNEVWPSDHEFLYCVSYSAGIYMHDRSKIGTFLKIANHTMWVGNMY